LFEISPGEVRVTFFIDSDSTAKDTVKDTHNDTVNDTQNQILKDAGYIERADRRACG